MRDPDSDHGTPLLLPWSLQVPLGQSAARGRLGTIRPRTVHQLSAVRRRCPDAVVVASSDAALPVGAVNGFVTVTTPDRRAPGRAKTLPNSESWPGSCANEPM